MWIKVVTASSGVLAELENKAGMSNLVQGSFSMPRMEWANIF